ncbi:aldehyde dehydrogenase family protein [Bacillus sp. JJ1533]|uniref:aldehyde dehydrogenase family protein n=1 Tax=Bacillus sp. JJ1533 TaxID=3122959 RepID=UPI002FFD6CF7
MREAVKHANKAQKEFERYSQEKVDHIIKSIAEAAFEASEYLARLAVEETQMGIVEHKKIKNELGSLGVYESIKNEKTVGVIHTDSVKKVTEIAFPFGVVGCIIPTTNPTSTAIFKTLISLKARNGIVVSPHPSAVSCTVKALEICNEAALKAGAPSGLIGWITHPTMPATTELMKHKDVHLILATGGGGLVRAAYSSGKPAYGVGPGNVPVYIDKSAPIKDTVRMIVDSKSFDNGTICATEQAMVVHKNVKEITIRELKNNDCYFLDEWEKEKVENIISPIKGKLNPAIVGRSAELIAEMAGVNVPKGTRVLIAEETHVGKNVPFSIEKLSPIFAFYTVNDVEEAKEICHSLLNIGGRGHSLSLHTKDEAVIQMFGDEMPVSRILVNTLASIGAAGATTGITPSFTLGCGSYGGNITSDNITTRHLLNIKRIAHGIRDVTIPKTSKYQSNEKMEREKTDQIEQIVLNVINEKKMDTQKIDSELVSQLVSSIVKKYQNE